jgi:Tfp pilus assembly protein PilF
MPYRTPKSMRSLPDAQRVAEVAATDPSNEWVSGRLSAAAVQYINGGRPAGNGFLAQLAELRVLIGLQSPDRLARTRAFAERNRGPLGFAAVLLAIQQTGQGQDSFRALAEVLQLFDHDPVFGDTARYERMCCLLQGGLPNAARQTFDDLFHTALAAGRLPALDATVKQLPANDAGPWTTVLHAAAAQRVAKGHPEDVIALAWQSQVLNEPALAKELLARHDAALRQAPAWVRVEAAQMHLATGNPAEAQALLTSLLDDARWQKVPGLWRLAALAAAQRNQTRRMAESLDRALELEFARPAEFVNVQEVRADYGALMNSYTQWLSALRQTESDVPADLAGRVVRAADRWRALDPEGTDVYRRAGWLLKDLDRPHLAWDYLTSPIALRPNEAKPLRELAQELSAPNDLALGERAYAAAFAAEPTDADLLWQRALLLRRLGRDADANAALTQLVDGTWQPRFSDVVNQARQALGR